MPAAGGAAITLAWWLAPAGRGARHYGHAHPRDRCHHHRGAAGSPGRRQAPRAARRGARRHPGPRIPAPGCPRGVLTLVQPDLFVVRKQPGQILKRWNEVGVPVLAIEFLSPGTAARDRGAKRRIYQGAGVAEYWIVDLDARLVERWRPGDARPEVVSEELVWEPLPAIAARLDLPTLFARVLGTA